MSRNKARARPQAARHEPVTAGRGRQPLGNLQMVILVEMTPDEFPGEIAASYAEACAILGVPSAGAGYGLELDQDESGARWTRVTSDVDGIRSAQAIWHSG